MTVTHDAELIDPFAPATLADPYPLHEILRERGPATWLPRYGVWAVARHAEVRQILGQPELFCSRHGVGLDDLRVHPMDYRTPSLLLESDPPEHDRPRRIVTDALSAGVVRGLAPRFEAAADRLTGQLLSQRTVDGVRDIAEAYPLAVIPDLLGLRPDGRENLLRFSRMVFNSFGPDNDLTRASREQGLAAAGWVAEACELARLQPGRLGADLHARGTEAGLPAADAGRLVRLFLSAGIDTTVGAIGGLLHSLAAYPGQWAILRSRPDLARQAFEEAVRFVSPLQVFFRTATAATRIGDDTIEADAKVLLLLAAANRDPRRFGQPDVFDIERPASGHVGFGFGLHACIGQALARLEGEILLQALVRRVARIEFAGEPELRLNNSMRGWERLPLRLTAA